MALRIMTKVIALPKGKGKTEAVIQWMLESPDNEHRIYVGFDLQSQHASFRRAYDKGLIDSGQLNSWQFIALDDLIDSDGGLWSGVVMMDEVEGVFRPFVLAFDNVDIAFARLLGRHLRIVPKGGITHGLLTLTTYDGD